MTRCHSCGQVIETERDKVNRDVFVATFVAVLFTGCGLAAAQWTVAWWAARTDLLCIQFGVIAWAALQWVRFVRVRRQPEKAGTP